MKIWNSPSLKSWSRSVKRRPVSCDLICTKTMLASFQRSSVGVLGHNFFPVPFKHYDLSKQLKSARKILFPQLPGQYSGCHFTQIYGELRKTLDYAHITKDAVLSCLQTLESSSEIVSTEPGSFMYFQLWYLTRSGLKETWAVLFFFLSFLNNKKVKTSKLFFLFLDKYEESEKCFYWLPLQETASNSHIQAMKTFRRWCSELQILASTIFIG